MNEHEPYRLDPETRYRLIDGETVVVRQRANELMVMNEIGGRVLRWIESATPIDELLDELVDSYQVERSRLARDVSMFIDELMAEGIVERIAR